MPFCGLSRSTFIAIHTIISFISIGSGLLVLFGLFRGKLIRSRNSVFLFSTILTSVTGFLFPFTRITPGIILGILSLLFLGVALFALYVFHLEGRWRATYVFVAMIPLYFNLFILVALLFQHVPVLRALTSAGDGFAFKISQVLLLVLAAISIASAARNFRANLL